MVVLTNENLATLSVISSFCGDRQVKIHLGVVRVLVNDFLPDELVLQRDHFKALEECRGVFLDLVKGTKLRVVEEVDIDKVADEACHEDHGQ